MLTARELVVLTLIVDGLTNPEIAERLTNSPRTVQSHVKSLMRKFGAHTRTQLAVYALRAGLVALHPAADSGSHPIAA
ncbi:LuxR C-terminal-related transcriptional regulator [Patulibacter sp. NPDC049589]|uniref:response regulator transcription factor n=1 Tax=Patulibacter sp. NPDC049589 TaxID=3154731 RepID=UPI00343C2904